MQSKRQIRKRKPKVSKRYSNKGTTTKVEPIRTAEEIERVKVVLADNPRDTCLFILGINTAYRACELVTITVGQVAHLKVGDNFELKQTKNSEFRRVTINRKAYEAIQNWLALHPCPTSDAPLFISQTTGRALKADTLYKYVKNWCRQAGLIGNYASHSMRKTFGYHAYRNERPAPDGEKKQRRIAELMLLFGHATERQTLDYLCIQDTDISALFMENELG